MGPKKSGVTKRSLRSGDMDVDKRPKRLVQTKPVDDSVGLSRQEEQELNKALYASLNDTRRSKSLPSLGTLDNAVFAVSTGSHGGSSMTDKLPSSKGSKITLGKKRSLRGGVPLPKRLFRSDSTGSSENDNLNIDESSKDSVKSSSSSANGSKRKIHAQRKFAQGCSLPGTPTCSPTKASTTPVKLLSRTPKTEDFLTFLCLRGSPALPPHLDFFNFSKEELPLRDDSPKLTSSSRRKRIHESCLDENSSSSGGANDDGGHKPPSAEKGKVSSSSKRSAARASAGTSETACGIVSLRRDLQRKGSSLGALTPVSSSPASNYLSQSSQKGSGTRGKHHRVPPTIAVLKSARKNLLGKLTSVARQSEKALVKVKPKKRLQISKGRGRLFKGNKSLSKRTGGQIRKLRKRKGKVTNTDSDDNDDDDKEDSEDESVDRQKPRNRRHSKNRGKSKKAKPHRRRTSERLKLLLRSPNSRRRRLISEDEDEELGLEQKVKVKKDGGNRGKVVTAEKTNSGSPSPPQVEVVVSKQKSNQQKKVPQPKARKPFKIRPPERVRTRGYSLMLASKIALKKAKSRDQVGGKDRDGSKGEGQRADGRLKVSGSSSSSGDTGGNSNSSSGGVSGEVTKKESDSVRDKGRKLVTTAERQQGESISSIQTRGLTSPETRDMRGKAIEIKTNTPSPKWFHTKKVKSSTSTSRPSSATSSTSSSSSPSSSKATTSSSSSKATSSSSSSSSSASHSIPIFRPSESEFINPMAYLTRIQAEAEPYGMCKIIPPASWKLDSSRVNEDIRFTPQVQYTHRLYNRWGPNVQRTAAINYHLLSELSANTAAPQIGGVEIDLPQLYDLVEDAGGLSKMADKRQWATVADAMNIPKQAMDRTMRLYDIYCRHILPYATLSQTEREDLEEEVKAIHELQTLDDDAIIRGKSMAVSNFCKISRNVQAMWFKDDPSPDQVESEYWHIVEEGERHVAVQCGHINTLTQASGFPTRKDSPYSKHPWNLNQIPNHQDSILKYLGPVAGTTIPTMHLGMLFSTSCWSTDPHSLPYIQYHHSGADIIWYSISKSQRSKFRSAIMETVSTLISSKPRWLKEDCVMVNPALLREAGVKVSKCVHGPREFVVVFPGTYTATITRGFSVSESVHYATSKWLPMGIDSALALTKSGEKELFSMSSLLCRLAQDKDINLATLTEALPLLSSTIYKELDLRTQLHAVGLRSDKKMLNPDSPLAGQAGASTPTKKRQSMSEEEKTCEICSRICHLSMVYVEQEEQVLCLEHGLKHIQRRKSSKATRLFVLYNQPELESILKGAKDRLVALSSP